ncbi:MAG: hypothetical protein IJS13_01700 [Paludibacteraceae bacterium]|nr:hypothetical protein [Paludibacteraceae bacterium]
MKTKIFLLLANVSALVLVSCGKTNHPDYVPDSQVAIIKLTPELQEHVFVSPIVDSVLKTSDNRFILYNGVGLALFNPNHNDSILANFVQSEFNILGTNPYVLLENGYAIIDWKWTHFHPLSGELRNTRNNYDNPNTYMVPFYSTHFPSAPNLLKNEEYYLLSLPWQDLKDLKAIWETNEGQLIDKPEIFYINTNDIEKYGKLSISSKDVPFLELQQIYNLYSKDEVSYCDCVKKMNMLQDLYVETLKQMINNNDIDTWKKYY